MRIGLLGGTFDPPHHGHLLIASDAFDALQLDRVIWIPAAVQPLKVGLTAAPAMDRLAMVCHLVDGDERFVVSAIEIERGGLSFTVDTLSALSLQWPEAELFWLVGADTLRSFAKWREPNRITELATVVVLQRGGDAPDLTSIVGLGGKAPLVLESRRVDISSTEIRERARLGWSIRGFVPDVVGSYIATAGLYR